MTTLATFWKKKKDLSPLESRGLRHTHRHLVEMCKAVGGARVRLDLACVPLLEGALEIAESGVFSSHPVSCDFFRSLVSNFESG